MATAEFQLFPFDEHRWWRYRSRLGENWTVRVRAHPDFDDQVQFRLEGNLLAPLAGIHRQSLLLMDTVKVGFAHLVQPQPLLVVPNDLRVGSRWNVLRFDGHAGRTLEHQVSAFCRIRTSGGEFRCFRVQVDEEGDWRLTCWIAPGIGIVSWRSRSGDGDFVDFGSHC
jgi:hypothetical protein